MLGLIGAIREFGFSGRVAFPGEMDSEHQYRAIPVHRFSKTAQSQLEHAYGAADDVAAASFAGLVRRLKPDIVHIHAHTSAISYRLVDVAHAAGAKVLFTYHTPTVSCLRGTMMLGGKAACDGVLDVRRCSTCLLQSHGVPEWAGSVLSRAGTGIGKIFGDPALFGKIATAANTPRLTALAHSQFRSLTTKVDTVVAVCRWVLDLLIANEVPAAKLVLCRQGVDISTAPDPTVPRMIERHDPRRLRVAYFGRIDPVKGVDILLDALKRVSNPDIRLDIYGVVQHSAEGYASALKRRADARVRFSAPQSPDRIREIMADYDFVAVPSRCLETGPLVVYEAFAAGTPVLGTRLGGITELVSHDVDGILMDYNDPRAWSEAISALAADFDRVKRLRRGVRRPRTMVDVAREMAGHYRAALAA